MKDRAFTPREHGESGEHTFMNLGRPIGCLGACHQNITHYRIRDPVFWWSDNASAESDVFSFVVLFTPGSGNATRLSLSAVPTGSSPTSGSFRARLFFQRRPC